MPSSFDFVATVATTLMVNEIMPLSTCFLTLIAWLCIDPTLELALFIRSGFNSSVKEAAGERDDLRLFYLGDVVAALETKDGL